MMLIFFRKVLVLFWNYDAVLKISVEAEKKHVVLMLFMN